MKEVCSSRLRACPSIQPKHSASSTACCQVSVVTVPPLRVRASHTPGDVAWLSSSQARSASASATTSSANSAFAMATRYRQRPAVSARSQEEGLTPRADRHDV